MTLRPPKKQNSNILLFPPARLVVASTPFTLGLPGEILKEKKLGKKMSRFQNLLFWGSKSQTLEKCYKIKTKKRSFFHLIFHFKGNRAIFEITRVFFSFTKSAENSTNFCQIFGKYVWFSL